MIEKYSEEELYDITVDNLREICKDFGIRGMSRARKYDIINAILDYYNSCDNDEEYYEDENNDSSPRPITSMIAVMNIQDGEQCDTINTTIHISCGASSGNFSVVGKCVAEVASKLKNVLNIDRISIGIVNGKEVEDSYILKNNDNLEFVKPAGAKGII